MFPCCFLRREFRFGDWPCEYMGAVSQAGFPSSNQAFLPMIVYGTMGCIMQGRTPLL
jgi:hypothetical protein